MKGPHPSHPGQFFSRAALLLSLLATPGLARPSPPTPARPPDPVLCLDALPADMRSEAFGRTGEDGNIVPDELTCALVVRVDGGSGMALDNHAAHLVNGLDPATSHLIAITCDGRPMESFRFRFPESGERDLVLSFGPHYRTWQLSPRRRTPPRDGQEDRRCFELARVPPPP